ncbi:hypothetical protein [Bacillus horti]|uniref:Cobalamin biosynthesis Mg chelatase CobN n=1 Tax=Caldalkalibacillus horti TaxID=77523 RepID=A0ABT9VZK2_9BACI|nr:hypothetical protein [Bacillus horti]MDQ0166413.1 cobalamin biosynthesis Mg chelatase CobN [Bacillus horti]
MRISGAPSTPMSLQATGKLKGYGLQGLSQNKFLEKAIQIAFSDASAEEKKLMFQNLKEEMDSEGTKAQLEELEKLQERINEKAREAVASTPELVTERVAESGAEYVGENEQGDVAVISKQAVKQYKTSSSSSSSSASSDSNASSSSSSSISSNQSSSSSESASASEASM